MRRAPLLLSLAICGGLACDSPTGVAPESATRFSLPDATARAFDDALLDARLRVLPALSEIDASGPLASSMDALRAAIATRDQGALRRALARTESAIGELARGDGPAAIASDLDAIRLIVEHARPLAYGGGDRAAR